MFGGFPVLKVYIAGGSSILYDGVRDEEAVMQYLTNYQRLPYKVVSKEQYEKITQRNHNNPIVTYYKGNPSAYDLQFNYACRRASTIIRCLIVNVSDTDFESVTIYRNFDGKATNLIATSIDLGASVRSERTNRRRTLSGPGDALYNWTVFHAYPAFPQFTAKSSSTLFLKHRAGFRTHVLFLLSSNRTDFMSSIDFIKDTVVASQEFRDKCLMAYIDAADNSDYIASVLDSMQLASPPSSVPSLGDKTIVETVHVDGEVVQFVPRIAIVQSEKTKVSFYQTEFTQVEPTLSTWLRSFFKGELKPYHVISTDS